MSPRLCARFLHGRNAGAALLLDKGLQQPLVLFAALLDEAWGRRYLELPDLERAFLLHPDDDKAGCQYCQAHTILAAERYGAAQEQLDHIWEFATHPAFNPAERAALAFTVAASAVPNTVNDALSNELRAHWNEGEIVEILGVVSLFGFLNRWNDSMGTTLEAGAVAAGRQHLTGQGWVPGKHA